MKSRTLAASAAPQCHSGGRRVDERKRKLLKPIVDVVNSLNVTRVEETVPHQAFTGILEF